MAYDFDVLVIGSGPGGYVAGIRASQLGLKAAVVERDKVGGVCLNIGCIPSKAIIHEAGLVGGLAQAEALGVKVDRSTLDYGKVFEKSRKAADTLSRGVQYLLKKNKVELVAGEASLSGPHEVTVSGKTIGAASIIIATGSRPREIPGFAFDEERVLSSTGALMLKRLPKRMLILGAGAIGVEFAHILAAFGVEVHVVEMMDRILPLEDEESSAVLARSFQKRGITVLTATRAVALEKGGSSARVTLEDRSGRRSALEAEQVMVVTGRTPNTDRLGLERLGIATQKGFVACGDWYQTSVASVYAIGDAINTPMLAHVASKEGETAVEHVAGLAVPTRIDPLSIPSGVYCEPQVASFGLTEAQAKEQGRAYQKAVFPYRGAGKSVAIGETEGHVKLLVEKETREILGAHVVGADATEIIHELLLARTAELLPEDIATMIHAHPTLSEAVMEAARSVEGWAIHI